jgi:hypothetical protein
LRTGVFKLVKLQILILNKIFLQISILGDRSMDKKYKLTSKEKNYGFQLQRGFNASELIRL